jgi:hypothetical protein
VRTAPFLLALSVVAVVGALTGMGQIAGSVAAPIFTAALAGALGYTHGRGKQNEE